jgi:hypothetical protein
MLTGCWLATLILTIGHYASYALPADTQSAAFIIVSTMISGVIILVMSMEATKSPLHMRTSNITCAMLMLIITVTYLLGGVQAERASRHTAFVIVPKTSALVGARNAQHCQKSTVYVDSGCTKTVFKNPRKLINHRPADGLYTIAGVGGTITATTMGDFLVALRDKDGKVHTRLIKKIA